MADLKSLLNSQGIVTDTFQVLGVIDGESYHGVVVQGAVAVDSWKKLRRISLATAHYPVILGDLSDAKAQLADAGEINPGPIGEILEFAKGIVVPAWIDKKKEMEPELYEELDEGDWPGGAIDESEEFRIPFEVLSKKPFREVAIVLVPTSDPAAIPAFLHYGNWNDCPAAEVHVAFASYWKGKYGAEIVGMTCDVVEMIVQKTPQTREEALVLAREQYGYCSDIVEQGVGTISNLAALLMKSRSWYFWWD